MMQAGLRRKQHWTVVAAVLLAIFLFYESGPCAEEGTPGDQTPAAEQPSGNEAPAAATAVEAKTEETVPPPAAVEATSEETTAPTAAAEPQPENPPPAPAAAEPESAATSTATAATASPDFNVGGLAIGMDLNEAKGVFDQILGFESTVAQNSIPGRTRLDGNGYASITGDANMRVVRMEFGQAFTDAVYQVEGLKAKNFANKFEGIYNIEMDIDITRRHPTWEYTAPGGVTVTISSSDTDNKTLVIEKK